MRATNASAFLRARDGRSAGGSVQWGPRPWGILVLVGIGACAAAWQDILQIALRDEEASHILLVPLACAWLLSTGRAVPVRAGSPPERHLAARWAGPLLVAAGALLSVAGFYRAIAVFWHAGALFVALGSFVAAAGLGPLWRHSAATATLAFLIPVPGMLRQGLSVPLQTATAWLTQLVLELIGLEVGRSGSVLHYHGVQIAVAEACNGLRMMFALFLVTWASVFSRRLSARTRVAVLLVTPLLAVACNVLRLLPTVWFYGRSPDRLGPVAHEFGGWLMLALAAAWLQAMLAWLSRRQRRSAAAGEEPGRMPREPARLSRRLPRLATTLLLIALFLETALRPAAADAAPFHERIAIAARLAPLRFGDWSGREVALERAAVELLHANVALSRIFEQRVTGRAAGFTLVQTGDARDLVGRYPPVCYPANGWSQESAEDAELLLEDLSIAYRRYAFSRGGATGPPDRVDVLHFMLIPGGRSEREMQAVQSAAADYTRRFYGAAQVLLVLPAEVPRDEQERIADEILRSHALLIREILRG